MRIACVLIPRFALAVELSERPELCVRSLVIGGAAEEARAVVECSPEAEQQGVRRGMPLREARAYCREALFLDARPALYRERHERMLTALEAVSPVVEGAEPGCAYVGLDGLAGRAGASEEAPPAGQDGCSLSAAPLPTPSFAPIFADERAAAGALAGAVAA